MKKNWIIGLVTILSLAMLSGCNWVEEPLNSDSSIESESSISSEEESVSSEEGNSSSEEESTSSEEENSSSEEESTSSEEENSSSEEESTSSEEENSSSEDSSSSEEEEIENSLTVAEKQLNKAVGERMMLSVEELGITVEGEATLSYTVEKTLGAGTTKSKTAEVHQIMAIEDNQFVVESGYFYDISITAAFTDGGSITEVVRVCASDVVVFGFETEAETSVSIGSGYLQFSKEEIDGNTVLKIWNPTGVTNTGAWFEWGTLLSSADMAVGETVTYDVYADVGHSYAVSSSNWALQLNQGGEGTVSGGYVTANARCKIGTVTYKTAGGLTTMYSNFVVQGANVNGNPNYFTFDNVVFVRTDLPVEETETSLTIASKQ